MKGNKKFALLYVFLAVVLSAGAVYFQHILNDYYLEKRSGHYIADVLTPEIFVIYTVLSVLLLLTVVFVLRFDTMPREMRKGSVNTAFFSAIVALVWVFVAIVFFMNNKTVLVPGSSEQMVYRLRMIACVTAFPSAVYFLLTTMSGKNGSKFLSFLSFFPLITTLFLVMSLYFDRSVLINSPVKSFQQVAFIVLMLYLLFEIRTFIGRTKIVMNLILSLISTLFLSGAFVPGVIDIVMGKANLSPNNVHCLIGGVMALYTLSRAIDIALSADENIVKVILDRRAVAERSVDESEAETDFEKEVVLESVAEPGGIDPVELFNSLKAVADGTYGNDDTHEEEHTEEDTEKNGETDVL